MILAVMAVAFGFISVGFFTLRQFALAEGWGRYEERANWFGVFSLAAFGAMFLCIVPMLVWLVGG